MDMGRIAAKTYAYSPVFLQNCACFVHGWREARVRYGRSFHATLDWLLETQNWPRERMDAYQDEQVRAIVRHAYETVPYYRRVFDDLRLRPDDIRSRRDLPKVPVLTKEQVRANFGSLVSQASDAGATVHGHTSGTTGKSLQFYTTRATIAFQWALWWRHRMRFGLHLGDLHANFTGKLVVPPSQNKPPYWRWNRAMSQAVLNMQHLTLPKIRDVMRFLNDHPFKFYSGYPSILHALARTAMDAGESLSSRPSVVATGAENMLDFQRRDIATFTGAVLTDQYGFSEACGNASQCESFRYHEDFEFGVMECVDGKSAGGGTSGRVVCTGFANPAFPLIRYEIGDTAAWDAETQRCRCGRQSRVLLSIDGRMDDYVVTPEGRRIMRFDYIFKDTHNVNEAQVVQHRLGEIVIRIVRRPDYGVADENLIRSEISAWISPRLGIQFDYVAEIERERNGKFRAVKSLLPKA